MRPIRSLLFAPASPPERLRKFQLIPADGFGSDLEDGTAAAD
jgi:citrate lyase beta subunit